MPFFNTLFQTYPPPVLIGLACILGVSGLMSGLSGFGFSAIGALSLWLLPPKLGVPLLMSLSTANQLVSLGQLKQDLRPIREWWPDGPAPYLLGGVLGVPLGLTILHSLPTGVLMVVFGVFLLGYAAYCLFKPDSLHIQTQEPPFYSGVIGFFGGLIGGFTAFPAAPVVVWTGLRRLPKHEARTIVQPFILGMQIVSLLFLSLQHPQTFSPTFWMLLVVTLPVVLPGTLIGVKLYRGISDINFRKVTFLLLGVSGIGLLAKAL